MPTTRKVRASRTDLARVLEDLKINIHRTAGEEIIGFCPRHYYNERTGKVKVDHKPSWQINSRTGYHICWSCGYGGSLIGLVIDLVFPKSDKPLWKATQWLSGYGREINFEELEMEERQPERMLPPKSMIEARFQSFREPSDRALAARRITREAARLYDLRVDPSTNLWVLPVHGPNGDLWGWQYKSKGYFHNVPENMPKSQTLFGLKQFQGGRAILVEAQLDVVRLCSVDIDGGLASMGVRVTEAQMELIIERATELISALDNPYIDKAGLAEARRLERLYGPRIKMLFAGYRRSDPKDPGEMEAGDIHRIVENAKMLGASKWQLPMARLAVSPPGRASRRRRTKSSPVKVRSSPRSLFASGVSGTRRRS